MTVQSMTDTIAAISTGMTQAGIGIIRISGERAIAIGDAVFRGRQRLKEVPSHTIHYGRIVDHDRMLDEVLVSVMRAPRTFTGEDTVEINCHGGMYVLGKVLSLVLQNGARAARPGEFSKRAFLNGKMDLTQAEAVMDLIQSDSEYAMKSSVSQLKGSVKKKVDEIRSRILYETAFIESALDDPEHISFDEERDKLALTTEEIILYLIELINSFKNGKIIKDGIKTAILGKPNAGKSSLLNALSGNQRAIVTDIEGTTRDVVEEQIRLGDITLHLMDTAGIRQTKDKVEKIGIERARDCAREADLLLCMIDGTRRLDENDDEILSLLFEKRGFILINKGDLDQVIGAEDVRRRLSGLSGTNIKSSDAIPILYLSARTGEGVNILEQKIRDMFFGGELQFNEEVYISNERQFQCLLSAKQSMESVRDGIREGLPEDFLSIDLMDAYGSLGEITGETVGEDLVNEIFGKFCMGK